MTSEKGREIMNKVASNDPNLPTVLLTGNDIDNASCIVLFRSLRKNMHVTTLILMHIGLRRDAIFNLMKTFIENTRLRYVKLVDNNLTLKMMEDLLVATSVQRTMEKLLLFNPRRHLTMEEKVRLIFICGFQVLRKHFERCVIHNVGVYAGPEVKRPSLSGRLRF